uniref:Transcriptional regulator, BadM/Rrf2 family n=1 Tax=Caulobacter sp. (strain K31) TaxID=366602 RepID=B0T972_CAUSK
MAATNIQFSVGVHIMQVLHVHADRKITSSFITESVNTDAGSVRLVLSKLAKAGLVTTTRGRGGSSALARAADTITMLDIYRATAAPAVFAVHGHPVEKTCVVSTHHKKTMSRVLEDCQGAFEASLARTRLSDVVEPMRRSA